MYIPTIIFILSFISKILFLNAENSNSPFVYISGNLTTKKDYNFLYSNNFNINNQPGGRHSFGMIKENDSIFIFCGAGYTNDSGIYLDDIWEFSISKKKWKFIRGHIGNDGTQQDRAPYNDYVTNVYHDLNTPGGYFYFDTVFFEMNRTVYFVFGSAGFTMGDVWAYSLETNQWKRAWEDYWWGWDQGPGVTVVSLGYTTYIYDGYFDWICYPPRMKGTSAIQVSERSFYTFGGWSPKEAFSGSSQGAPGPINIIFEYDVILNLFRVVSGERGIQTRGDLGEKGNFSSLWFPRSRDSHSAWFANDKMWIYGGRYCSYYGSPTSCSPVSLADLCAFDINIKQWAYMSGSLIVGTSVMNCGSEGCKTFHPDNLMTDKYCMASWTDGKTYLAMFSGGNEASNKFSDIWTVSIADEGNITWRRDFKNNEDLRIDERFRAVTVVSGIDGVFLFGGVNSNWDIYTADNAVNDFFYLKYYTFWGKDVECDPECENGDCVEGTCYCHIGYTGSVCEGEVVVDDDDIDDDDDDESKNQNWIYFVIGGSALGGLLLLVLICIVCSVCFPKVFCYPCYYRKTQATKFKKIDSIMDSISLQEVKATARGEKNLPSIKVDKKLFMIDFSSIKLIENLGTSGSGATIYRTEYFGKAYCLKLFNLGIFETQDSFNDFQKEANFLIGLRHPNIISCAGCCIKKSRAGILLEFCELGSIEEYIKKNPHKLSFKKKLLLLHQISKAMKSVHERGVIHRDLTCSNILLTEKNGKLIAKLIDFSISRFLDNSLKTMNIGTSFYMAPELVLSTKYNGKVDVYSFSMVCYAVLEENFEPFGENVKLIELKTAVNEENRPNFRKKHPDWMENLIKKMWKKSADKRPSFEEISKVFKSNL